MRTRWRGRSRGGLGSALWIGIVATAGCSSDAVGPDDPVRLVSLVPAEPSATAGEVSEALLRVRVETAAGDPVEGAIVRFQPTDAGGFVDPPLAASDADGVVGAAFVAGIAATTVRVRADLPDHPGVPALAYRVSIVPAAVFSIVIEGGSPQGIEVGTQTPIPLAVRLLPAGAAGAAGRPVVWRIGEGTAGARLTGDTVLADAEGRASILLTAGREPGDHRVRAFVAEPFASDTASFQVAVVSALVTGVRIDSVRPPILLEGREAVIFGAGLAAPGGPPSDVRVEGTSATVIAAGPERLEIVLPDFSDRCLPARRAGVRVLAGGGIPSNGVFVSLVPARTPVALGPGETAVVAASAATCFDLVPSSAELVLAVQSASRVDGGRAPLRLSLRSGDAVGGEPLGLLAPGPTGDAAAALASPDVASALGLIAGPGAAVVDPELRLRRAALEELRRSGARPAPGRGDVPFGALHGVQETGDTLRFAFAVTPDLGVSCTDTAAAVTGVVRRSGARAILVEDVNAPRDGFADAEWDLLARELEEASLPAVEEWFGETADIDGNGRTLFLFTPEVNRLTPRGSGALLAGFFLVLDLLDSGDPEGGGLTENGEGCPTSNEAEILYLPVADPSGEAADPFLRDRALANARSIGVHEMQHLISAERRLVLGGADADGLEEAWLGEGLSHIAEEIVGLAVAGEATGGGLTFGRLAGTRAGAEAFRAFHFQNFARLRLHLIRPETTPAIALFDPLGFESLQMRGFAWIFLRWLADRASGGDERALFRRLAGGGPGFDVGIPNVEGASGLAWEGLLPEFALALAADDLAGSELPPGIGIATWDLRRTFAELQTQPGNGRLFPPEGYPLALARLATSVSGIGFEIGSSTASYFALGGSGSLPAIAVQLLSPTGEPPAASDRVQVVVGRIR